MQYVLKCTPFEDILKEITWLIFTVGINTMIDKTNSGNLWIKILNSQRASFMIG